ncbi:MAG: YceI family protein [Thiobacillaceae bacterium]
MRRMIFLAGLMLVSLAAPATEYRQLQASSLSFAYKQMGVPMEGRFGRYTAHIVFDPARPDAAQARFELELASIDTGVAEADEEVLGKLWFNVKVYPVARFVSSGVKALGGNRYTLFGKLTIKGKTLNVATPFTFKTAGANGIFDGAFTLKRLDYAIGEGEWADVSAVANEVQIKFHFVAASAAVKP